MREWISYTKEIVSEVGIDNPIQDSQGNVKAGQTQDKFNLKRRSQIPYISTKKDGEISWYSIQLGSILFAMFYVIPCPISHHIFN